jgi:alkanesulfonate monooxygenase SsuD/methylene tetrahydromethanopterin reductase-like flavin-dependent oxidoreductase (luciferase family)
MTTVIEARRPLRLGFLTNVPFSSDPGGAARGLEEALELFELAESMGLDTGWVRQRHFDNYLASPLPMLAAVAQRTRRIRLGTAIISVRFEDPIRLAEDAATVDLLSDGRLELGLAGGIPTLEAIFGPGELEHREETQDRLRRFREVISGKPVPPRGQVADQSLPDFFVRPQSPGLGDRVWYGAGSPASAARAGASGLKLLLSTLNTDPTSESFEETQRDSILAHRAAWTETARVPRVCVSRIFMPAVNARQRELYADFDRVRQAEGAAGPRPKGALEPATFVKSREGARNNTPANIQLCPVYHGDPDEVLAAAQSDVALALADELMIWQPPNFTFAESCELLENIVEHIAPALGWAPAAQHDQRDQAVAR